MTCAGGRFIYPSTTPSETSSLLSPAPQSEVDTPTSDEEEVTVPTYGTIQSSSALPTSIATPTLTSDHSPFLSGVLRMFNLTLSLLREETVVLLVIILFAMMSQMVLEVTSCYIAAHLLTTPPYRRVRSHLPRDS